MIVRFNVSRKNACCPLPDKLCYEEGYNRSRFEDFNRPHGTNLGFLNGWWVQRGEVFIQWNQLEVQFSDWFWPFFNLPFTLPAGSVTSAEYLMRSFDGVHRDNLRDFLFIRMMIRAGFDPFLSGEESIGFCEFLWDNQQELLFARWRRHGGRFPQQQQLLPYLDQNTRWKIKLTTQPDVSQSLIEWLVNDFVEFSITIPFRYGCGLHGGEIECTNDGPFSLIYLDNYRFVYPIEI